MTSRDFCYWLQGYFELSDHPTTLTSSQANEVRKHLALVFKHEIDPSMGDSAHQTKLNEIHASKIGGTDPVSGLIYRC